MGGGPHSQRSGGGSCGSTWWGDHHEVPPPPEPTKWQHGGGGGKGRWKGSGKSWSGKGGNWKGGWNGDSASGSWHGGGGGKGGGYGSGWGWNDQGQDPWSADGGEGHEGKGGGGSRKVVPKSLPHTEKNERALAAKRAAEAAGPTYQAKPPRGPPPEALLKKTDQALVLPANKRYYWVCRCLIVMSCCGGRWPLASHGRGSKSEEAFPHGPDAKETIQNSPGPGPG